MPQYIGVKIIGATPMTAQRAGVQLGRPIDTRNADAEGNGYLVAYEDGYTSWSPKAQFEAAYRKADGMTFGLAIEAMKKGFKVTRKIWGGFWQLEEIHGMVAPVIIAHLKTGGKCPATAYQEDMLADDWRIVE